MEEDPLLDWAISVPITHQYAYIHLPEGDDGKFYLQGVGYTQQQVNEIFIQLIIVMKAKFSRAEIAKKTGIDGPTASCGSTGNAILSGVNLDIADREKYLQLFQELQTGYYAENFLPPVFSFDRKDDGKYHFYTLGPLSGKSEKEREHVYFDDFVFTFTELQTIVDNVMFANSDFYSHLRYRVSKINGADVPGDINIISLMKGKCLIYAMSVNLYFKYGTEDILL